MNNGERVSEWEEEGGRDCILDHLGNFKLFCSDTKKGGNFSNNRKLSSPRIK